MFHKKLPFGYRGIILKDCDEMVKMRNVLSEKVLEVMRQGGN